MSLKMKGYILLPVHKQAGGFDHATVHQGKHLLYVAHTANDAVDVIDCTTDHYLRSIPDLTGVAGALVSEERNLVFTSNRGEDTISIFSPDAEDKATKIGVGIRPNGLSFDTKRKLLLAANVGNPEIPNSFTISIVDVEQKEMIASIPVAGRTRWTVFDSESDMFYVNIMHPAQIVLVDANHPNKIAQSFDIPAKGPHGLDLDLKNRRLFCACDDGNLITLSADNGKILDQQKLSGAPDVIFYNSRLEHLYVTIGDPGIIDVFDTSTMQTIKTIPTEPGAHTIAFDADRNKVYAFLPETHRAMIFTDE
jgi:DNA-binding beta-propeller fold protein YncE